MRTENFFFRFCASRCSSALGIRLCLFNSRHSIIRQAFDILSSPRVPCKTILMFILSSQGEQWPSKQLCITFVYKPEVKDWKKKKNVYRVHWAQRCSFERERVCSYNILSGVTFSETQVNNTQWNQFFWPQVDRRAYVRLLRKFKNFLFWVVIKEVVSEWNFQ